MSTGLLPWLVPITVVIIGIVGAAFGLLGVGVILLIMVPSLVAWRLRDLEEHPPGPELETKPFWKF